MSHFKPEEFWCRCGRADCPAQREPHPALLVKLEAMRTFLARPLIINSGIRCPWWNAASGGKPNSEHLTGESADVRLPGAFTSRERWELLNAAIKAGVNRVGIGGTFLHVGVSRSLVQDVAWTY